MLNRREFIRNLTLASASLPLFNIARAGVTASSKINHASFGAGGMAFADINSLTRSDKINLVAVAEVDETRLGQLKEKFPDVKLYKDWRVLLDKEGHHLDSINVSTPDHMHATMGAAAMQLGLHVYGQKPLGQTLYETRRLAEIAKETGVVTQLGIQLASSIYERLTVQMVQDGVIGKVKEVYIFTNKTWGDSEPLPDRSDPIPETLEWDLWCGVAAERPYIGNQYYTQNGWRKRIDFGTGTLGDMGCHLYNGMYTALALSQPISIRSTGGQPNATNWALDEAFEYVFQGTEYTAESTIKVHWCDGSLRPPEKFLDMFGDKMPDQGSIFVGTEGILLQPLGRVPIPYPRENFSDYKYPKLEPRNHYLEFVDAIGDRSIQPITDFARHGGPLTETVLLGALASRFPQQTLEWDAKNLRVKNFEEANQFISKSYREGWEVKGLSA